MKVTVCFGNIRVVVPCGNGDLLVTQLIDKAIFRYKKAINKPLDYWVTVHSLKSLSDGGILDFDDRLSDVADDREQLIAFYEEQDVPLVPHNGGDGTSASSTGSPSPDIFRGSLNNNNDHKYNPYLRQGNKNDVVITHNDLTHGSSLIVRRGSEPALNNLGKSGNSVRNNLNKSQDEKSSQSFASTKRWSAIAVADDTKTTKSLHDFSEEEDDEDLSVPFQRRSGSGEEMRSAFSKFARNSSRQSLASNSSAVFRWMEAQQQAEEEEEEEREIQLKRKEPLGGSGNGDDDIINSQTSPQGLQGQVIILESTKGPLGIHVVPDVDPSGRDMGLVIQSIEPGGLVYRDGRLHAHDRIIEINNTSLVDVDFNKAQDLFKQAIKHEQIRLRVIKAEAPPLPQQPPPLLMRAGFFGSKNLNISNNSVPSPIKLEDLAPTPSRQVPPKPPLRHPSTTLSSPTKTDAPELPPPPKSAGKSKLVAPTNTRKIGKKININLTKGTDGLGFSVTTRDNTAGISAPIYIKNILPKGAAVVDGNLKSGDRLLEVNAIEMTGKSQAEAVSILRNTKLGSQVKIVVSRQVLEEEVDSKSSLKMSTGPSLQLQEKANVATEDAFFSTSLNREVLSFDIPLHGSGSAGLGVSVKGKTSTTEHGTQDLGIFIKSVIAGGAAAKDERLLINDQLLEVNSENLAEKSNAEAMETLRLAMQKPGPKPGNISVVIGRRPGLSSFTQFTTTPSKDLIKSTLEISGSDSLTLQGLPPSGSATAANKDTPDKSVPKTPSEKLRTPSIDNLMDNENEGGIRNLSYMKATHDSFMDMTSPAKTDEKAPSTPVKSTSNNAKNTPEKNQKQQKPSKVRPASTLGFSRSALESVSSAISISNDEIFEDGKAPNAPGWLVEWDKHRESTSSEVCQEDGDIPFSREGFGRQSMSEKRRGHLDPRISEFYNKLKESRSQNFQSATWERKKSASVREDKRSSVHTGPHLGLKKSSSLESLQTAVQDATLDDDEANQFRAAPNRGMVRGRGCNDSFRAAVDRSYDSPAEAEAMETARRVISVQEESSENGSNTKVPPPDAPNAEKGAGSKRSSISSEQDAGNKDGRFDEVKSEKKKTDRRDREKDKGLFKGLGHMFRFGKHRKGEEDSESQNSLKERLNPRNSSKDRKKEDGKHGKARKVAIEEHEKLQEEYRKLQEKQRQFDEQQAALKKKEVGTPPATRAARIQQLREEHQKRHRERQGEYPLDKKEELYEKKIREFEKKRILPEGMYPTGDYHLPPRRQVPELYERYTPKDPFSFPYHLNESFCTKL